MTDPNTSLRRQLLATQLVLGLLVAAFLCAATPGFRQLLLDNTNKPTTQVSLSSTNWTGTLDAARLPADPIAGKAVAPSSLHSSGTLIADSNINFDAGLVLSDGSGNISANSITLDQGAIHNASDGSGTWFVGAVVMQGHTLTLDASTSYVLLDGQPATAGYADASGVSAHADSATNLDDAGAAIIDAVGFNPSGTYPFMTVGNTDIATLSGHADYATYLDDGGQGLIDAAVATVNFDASGNYPSMRVGTASAVIDATSITFANGGTLSLDNAGGNISSHGYDVFEDGSVINVGGFLNMNGGDKGPGGSIQMADNGGYLNMESNGGSFDSSNGGGSVTTNQGGGIIQTNGHGSPEGLIGGPVGSLYCDQDGGAGAVLYVKETGGSSPTGWVAK